jgi:hypothetical protein
MKSAKIANTLKDFTDLFTSLCLSVLEFTAKIERLKVFRRYNTG